MHLMIENIYDEENMCDSITRFLFLYLKLRLFCLRQNEKQLIVMQIDKVLLRAHM